MRDDHSLELAYLFELEVLQDLDSSLEVRHADGGLCPLRERSWRAHLLRDRVGDIAETLLILVQNALQQIEPFIAAGFAKRFKCSARSIHRLAHVGLVPGRDVAGDPLVRWVDDG